MAVEQTILYNKNMFCIVYGKQLASIKSRQKKIVQEHLDLLDDFNFVRFDATNVTIQDILKEASYLPLGYDKKVIIVDNAYFLIKPKPRQKIESEQDYRALSKYIKTLNRYTLIIFSFEGSSFDKDGTIGKQLLAEPDTKVYEIKDPTKEEFELYVKRYFKEKLKTDIDPDAIKELIKRISGDLISFQNNAAKLALYTNHVTYEDVCLLVSRPLEENAFQIFNFLLMKKNNQALALYRDLRTMGVEPVTLISMLANQFRLLDEIAYLSKDGLSPKIISEELNINQIRVEIMKKNIYTLSESTIHKTLQELYNLDLNIKSGLVDRFYAFELFLINFKVY